jgi:peptidoglycan/LPS O-acetylase OafA/YrhL
MFTIICSSNQASDVFFAISGFLGVYKCIQIYEANGGKLTVKDTFKIYLRKFLRLAPITYYIFFCGWMFMSRFKTGPVWMNTRSLYDKCD